VLERASARETTARVAIGSLAKQFLRRSESSARYVASIARPKRRRPHHSASKSCAVSPKRRSAGRRSDAERKIIAEIDECKKAGDTLGGIVEVVATGLPVESAATCNGSQARRTSRVRAAEPAAAKASSSGLASLRTNPRLRTPRRDRIRRGDRRFTRHSNNSAAPKAHEHWRADPRSSRVQAALYADAPAALRRYQDEAEAVGAIDGPTYALFQRLRLLQNRSGVRTRGRVLEKFAATRSSRSRAT